jgi:hypothetical protein
VKKLALVSIAASCFRRKESAGGWAILSRSRIEFVLLRNHSDTQLQRKADPPERELLALLFGDFAPPTSINFCHCTVSE